MRMQCRGRGGVGTGCPGASTASQRATVVATRRGASLLWPWGPSLAVGTVPGRAEKPEPPDFSRSSSSASSFGSAAEEPGEPGRVRGARGALGGHSGVGSTP